MFNLWIAAGLIGVVIIVLLALYVGKLLWQLTRQTSNIRQMAQAKFTAHQALDLKTLNSAAVITWAMKEKQCDLAEGCWRLSVLLASLTATEQIDQRFPAIFALYNNIKHMPIREARKDLTKQQRMKQDVDRLSFEAELQESIFHDLDRLQQYINEQIGLLSPQP